MPTKRPLLPLLLLGLSALPSFAGDRRSVLIVDWGHDWGTGWYREQPDKQANPPQKIPALDLNANGTLEDDFANGQPYSFSEPLSPSNYTYDYTLPSARFYGGAVVRVTDVPKDDSGAYMKPRGMTEGHINQNHELRDDWNLMAMPTRKRDPQAERYAAAIVCLWKKEDFLNGAGGDARVSFRGKDYVGVFISRYWGGINWGRWIVQNGDTLYISKPTFGGETRQFDLETSGKENGAENPIVRRTHAVAPAEVEWAEYRPSAPADILFDSAAAKFAKIDFNDVRAIGFLAQRDLSQGHPVANGLWALPYGIGEAVALKFNAVQAVATVELPAPSPNVDLVSIGAASSPALYAGRTEVTFAQWRKIWRWAVTNQRASRFSEDLKAREIPGYAFLSDGAMGSMAMGAGTSHTPDEPATNLTWFDAVAWCNALSELEGLEPAYYEDAGFTLPYRRVAERAKWETFNARKAVHWKTSANGYRLPTKGDWSALASGGRGSVSKPDNDNAWIAANSGGRTHAVAGRAAAPNGLHDLLGNVSEYLWIDSPGAAPERVEAAGGSFRYPEDENIRTPRPFAERPFAGSDSIGFRVVRNGPAYVAPAAAGSILVRSIAADLVVPPAKPLEAAQLKTRVQAALREVSVPNGVMLPDGADVNKNPASTPLGGALSVAGIETSYQVFDLVRQWAVAEKGYTFNYAGDMGSLDYATTEVSAAPRSPAEPVTNLSWVDSAVWCNALSELCGLAPAYVDAATGEPVRRANPFRLGMYVPYQYPNLGNYAKREVDTAAIVKWRLNVSGGGYRLPGVTELEALREKKPSDASGWVRGNAEFRTHPVGTKAPALAGLYDIEGNVMEWTYGGSSLFGQNRFGNNFAYPAGGLPHKANQQESMFVGRAGTGFRVVRNLP